MLQRAASNAYSWWWASHIRTKQSKWLEQSLQDMEEKVQYVLKLIEEDGDSFAKRAEMYYKKRPELIHFVEESYRAFRALAERYDHLSTELQNANNKIATVFPDEVQLGMDDEENDDYGSPGIPKNSPQNSAQNAPKAPMKDLKGLLTITTKELQNEKTTDKVVKSGFSKSEALEEIDRFQKDILALQTVKEFAKSSYESGLTKYRGIENQIMEMQQKVCRLQDEFDVGKVIDDDEARTLMAEAALRSCQETLTQLLERHESSTKEAKEQYKMIEDAREKLTFLKHKFLPDYDDKDKQDNKEVGVATQEKHELEVHFDELVNKGSLMVTELADKIDEVVNKVISLEDAVSCQTALINRLRTETGDLQVQIQYLEDDKAILINDTYDLSNRLKKMEERLHGIQDLNRDVEDQNNHLQTYFTEARSCLDYLSQKLQSVKPDEEIEVTDPLQEYRPLIEAKSQQELEGDGFGNSNSLETGGEDKETDNNFEKCLDQTPQDTGDKQPLPYMEYSPTKTETQEAETEKDDEPNWQQMLLSGLEDKEKILLTEYTTILRHYKDVKKKLSEVEKNNRDSLIELRSAIAKRDEEIQSLHQRLNMVQESLGGNDDLKEAHWSIYDILNDPIVKTEDSALKEYADIPSVKKEEEEIKLILIDQPRTLSPIEEKLRINIDAILEENLDFWLRFSTAFHQIQKFKTAVQNLQDEILQLKDKKKEEGSIETDLKSDVQPMYKHLREIQTELLVWLEQSTLLKDELQHRFSSLCNIQEEITIALKEGVEAEEIRFSSHHAAKFQGEVLNMKQENNKVREELQAGLNHVTSLQFEIGKTLAKLDAEFEFSGPRDHNQPQATDSGSKSRVPLRSFIFGNKPKKQKHSIFFTMLRQRNYHDLRGKPPM